MKNNNAGSERRKFVRLSREYVLQYEEFRFSTQKISNYEGTTENISAGGVLIETEEEYSTGTLLKLKIRVPDWEKCKSEFLKIDQTSLSEPFVVLGKVVRVKKILPQGYEIGLHFVSIDEDHRQALRRYLEGELEKGEFNIE